MNDQAAGHPGVDTLCDLDEGLLAGTPGEADVEAHVARCATCADFLASLATTRQQLAALPAELMPADVAARIDAALAAEAARDAAGEASDEAAEATAPAAAVTSLDSARRKRTGGSRWARGAGAVAACFALLTAGVIGFDAVSGVNEGPASTSGAADSKSSPKDNALREAGSAPNFDQSTLAAGVRALVAGRRSGMAAAPQTKSAAPGTQQDAVDPPGLDRLRSPAELTACIAELTGKPGIAPLAVEYARYDGEPAVIIVLPDADPAIVQAWVVGPQCSTGNTDLRHREPVTRAG